MNDNISRIKKVDTIYLNIPIEKIETYEQEVTMQNLLNTKGFLPTDIFSDIEWHSEKEDGFARLCTENELVIYRIPKLVVLRIREETDEEYSRRINSYENYRKQKEKIEYDEYLRLKAKFENQ